jgi:hypothetical protein
MTMTTIATTTMTMTTATAMTTTTIATATTTMMTTMTTAAAETTMTTTKRAAGEVRFLATKAIVGGLSVATFVGAWVLVAATAGGAKAEDQPEAAGFETASRAAQAPAIIERQVIYYVVGTNTEGQLPPLQRSSVPAANIAPQAPAAPPAPKAATKQVAKKSRGS